MPNFKYEVDENNVVRLWDVDNPNEDNIPILIQPQKPTDEEWSNKKEAIDWIEGYLEDLAEQERLAEEARLAEEDKLEEVTE